MNVKTEPAGSWRFTRKERRGLTMALCAILVFGTVLEFRTALRRAPMTDLGVFACAAGAVRSGDNIYNISDWHGWHYQYPPALAILFTPLAHPQPAPITLLPPGVPRTAANTPWGYYIDAHSQYYGLHGENRRFFGIVAVWYVISVGLIIFSAHALACVLEGSTLKTPPPSAVGERRRWWWLRTLPLLVCAGSLATDLSRGQVDVLMLAAVAGGLYLISAQREFTAGICLSFPATVKLFPPFLLLYPFWRRRWRMSAGIVGGLILTLAILPAATLGPKRTVELYRNWVDVLAKPALGHGTDTSRAKELTGINASDNQSLLAFFHNWKHYNLPPMERPPKADPGERYAVYAVGVLLLLGVGVVSGIRRHDGPQDLLIIAGLLVGLAFVVSPIVHNYYYLVLLPLVAALLDRSLAEGATPAPDPKLRWVLVVFLVVDVLARLPPIGNHLRDIGLPLLSMVALMCAGAMVLLRKDVAPGVVANASHPCH